MIKLKVKDFMEKTGTISEKHAAIKIKHERKSEVSVKS